MLTEERKEQYILRSPSLTVEESIIRAGHILYATTVATIWHCCMATQLSPVVLPLNTVSKLQCYAKGQRRIWKVNKSVHCTLCTRQINHKIYVLVLTESTTYLGIQFFFSRFSFIGVINYNNVTNKIAVLKLVKHCHHSL